MRQHMVYLDCDGVFTDFTTGICATLGIEFPGFDKWPWSQDWNWFQEAGFTWEQAHAVCDTPFWANLQWMPDGKDILREVWARFLPIEITMLTTPMDHNGSFTGKAQWIAENIPELWRRFIPTYLPKEEFTSCGFNSLLVDDADSNIEKFIQAGGAGILVPRPYNKNSEIFYAGEAVNYIADRLDKWIELAKHPAKNRRTNACQK